MSTARSVHLLLNAVNVSLAICLPPSGESPPGSAEGGLQAQLEKTGIQETLEVHIFNIAQSRVRLTCKRTVPGTPLSASIYNELVERHDVLKAQPTCHRS